MAPLLTRKRLFVLLLIPVFALLVILFPFLLSSRVVLEGILGSVNKQIAGTLRVDSCLIGWQQGFLCQDVSYDHPSAGLHVSVPSITSDRGLLELLLASDNLGTVHIDSPEVRLTEAALQGIVKQGRESGAPWSSQPGSVGGKTPFWDHALVKLQSRNGVVSVSRGADGKGFSLVNISADASLVQGVATFEMGLYTPGQGFVESAGSVNLPAHAQGWLETIIAEASVKVSSMPLADILDHFDEQSSVPRGKGFLTGDLYVKSAGLESLEVGGIVELNDVRLHGGAFSGDTPYLRNVKLSLEQGKWSRSSGFSIQNLSVASDTLNMEASAQSMRGTAKLDARGSLHLPVLFDQFPHLFRVNEATFVDTGQLDFAVNLDSEESRGNVDLKAKVKDVGGIYLDSRFFWDTPIALIVKGQRAESDLQVDALQFDAPFSRISGSGSLQTFALDGLLDVQKALEDVGMIFETDLSGIGNCEIRVRSAPGEGAPGKFMAKASMRIPGFTLLRGENTVVPSHEFSLTGSLDADDSILAREGGELELQAALSSWGGEIFLALAGSRSADQPFRGFYSTDSELNLGLFGNVFRPSHAEPGSKHLEIDGTLQLQSEGLVTSDSLEILALHTEIEDFLFADGETAHLDPHVRITHLRQADEKVPFVSVRQLIVAPDRQSFFARAPGTNLIDFTTRTVYLHDLSIKAETAHGDLDTLRVSGWDTPGMPMVAAGTLTLDMDREAEALTAGGFGNSTATKLLSKIHPLFGSLAQISGRLGVRFQPGGINGDQEGEEEMSQRTTFDARHVSLQPGEVLGNVLGIFGLSGQQLKIQDKEINCSGSAQVTCAPLRISAGKKTFTLGGTLSSGGAIDYWMEIPFPPGIADQKVFEALAGQTVKVMLSGTLEQPEFDREKVFSDLQEMVGQVERDLSVR